MTEAKPIDIPLAQIESLYGLADSRGQVNWAAQYILNPEFTSGLVPYIYRFLDKNIKRVTYNSSQLKAVVGISGGLDSTATAVLVADTMRKAQKEGTVQNSSLVLLGFKGMSEEDYLYAQKFAEAIGTEYPDLSIDFYTQDLTSHLRMLDREVDDMVTSTKRNKVYSGELTTRFIALMLMEYGDRTGHCVVDTTNGTEIILGELVINGGGECAPLADLYKSQVFDIAEVIGVPDFILNRPPINSTFGHDKVATYFREVPPDISPRGAYRVLDPILYYLYERKYKPATISKLLGHSEQFIKRVYRRINDQNHRRDIPYFAFNDRHKVYRRENLDLSNTAMLKVLQNSLAIGG